MWGETWGAVCGEVRGELWGELWGVGGERTFFPFSMHTGPAEATSQTAGAALVVFAPSEITSDSR